MNKFNGLPYFAILEAKRVLFGIKHSAEVDVTDNCNLRCKHCYHFHGKKQFRTKELPIETWEARFRDLRKKGIRFILLVGGEPALRKDVLRLADRMFPFVYVITNGTINIDDDFRHRLYVSIDGSPATNDSMRGRGVFSRIMKNYAGDRRVVINMTITKSNYREIENVVKIAQKSGFGGVVCNVYSHAIGMKDGMVIKPQERSSIIREMRRVKSLYPKDFLVSEAMIKWYEQPDHRDHCYWGDDVLHFDVSWNRRRCFGNNADCSDCGCLAGALQSYARLLSHPREMLRMGFI